MYSPKISEELVPLLYQAALARKIPMTKLVNRIIKDYFDNTEIKEGGNKDYETETQLDRLQDA